MRFLRSRWFLASSTLLALSTAWIFWGAEWWAERQWQAYAADARARGVRWTLAEFRPERVPPEEDISLLPIFASPEDWDALFNRMPIVFNARKQPDGGPRMPDWSRTRVSWAAQTLKDKQPEPDDLCDLDEAVGELQGALDQLLNSRAIAGNWDEAWVVNSESSYGSSIMRSFRLLDLRTKLDLSLNRSDEAWRALQAQIRLTRAVRRLPTLLMSLVSVSGDAIIHRAVWYGLEIGGWSNAALEELALHFLHLDTMDDFVWHMETERANTREIVEVWIGDADRVLAMIGRFGGLPEWQEWMVRIWVSRRSWWRENQLWLERSQDEWLSMFDVEEGVWRPIERKFDPEKLSKFDREANLVLAAESVSSTFHFAKAAVFIHAQNKMAALACALELCRRATGKYPETLEALVPAYSPRLPVDPGSGVGFRYRVEPDGTYLLYSIGLDGLDQGGAVGEDNDRSASDPDWRWWAPQQKR